MFSNTIKYWYSTSFNRTFVADILPCYTPWLVYLCIFHILFHILCIFHINLVYKHEPLRVDFGHVESFGLGSLHCVIKRQCPWTHVYPSGHLTEEQPGTHILTSFISLHICDFAQCLLILHWLKNFLHYPL